MTRSSSCYLFSELYEPRDGKLAVLEENERRVCSRLEKTEVLVVEKSFLFRVDTRTGLVFVHPWRFNRDRVEAGAMAKKCP